MSDIERKKEKSELAAIDSSGVPSSPGKVGTWLNAAVERLGGIEAAAEVADKSVKQMRRYLAGHEPPLFVAKALAEQSGLSLDSILDLPKGTDLAVVSQTEEAAPFPSKRAGGASSGIRTYYSADELGDEFVLVPRYDVKAAAGYGAVIHSEQIVDHLAFKAEWVRRQLRVNPEYLLLIEAMGDSMEDTISDGDLLLVNTQEPRIKDNAIYAISVNGDLIVKRVQRRLDGTIMVMSDNPRYRPEEVPPHTADQLRVIGQVVWHGGLVR
ncbi:helix-turn-helix transcriptional regulator [Telmatospirillum sp. J64-1]|uniref:S24 family peptidase n=1 Tax=Telmatospirillum sp. J64-1 TaxID=2502183 RepID=UPI00115E0171|nr:helix-turn-helix transcriptional regulator [Telmatospirillum sp. J64-1]